MLSTTTPVHLNWQLNTPKLITLDVNHEHLYRLLFESVSQHLLQNKHLFQHLVQQLDTSKLTILNVNKECSPAFTHI